MAALPSPSPGSAGPSPLAGGALEPRPWRAESLAGGGVLAAAAVRRPWRAESRPWRAESRPWRAESLAPGRSGRSGVLGGRSPWLRRRPWLRRPARLPWRPGLLGRRRRPRQRRVRLPWRAERPSSRPQSRQRRYLYRQRRLARGLLVLVALEVRVLVVRRRVRELLEQVGQQRHDDREQADDEQHRVDEDARRRGDAEERADRPRDDGDPPVDQRQPQEEAPGALVALGGLAMRLLRPERGRAVLGGSRRLAGGGCRVLSQRPTR